MANTIDPVLVSYKMSAPAYASVTQNPLPHVLPELAAYKMVAPAYATVTQNPLQHVLPTAVPYKLVPPAYAQVKDVSLPVITSSPDPDSTPYIEVSELVPDPGAIGVATGTTALLPCADRIIEEDETEINLFDTGAYTPPSRGLDPAKTVITAQYDSDPPETVYESGAPLPGWTVTSTPNRYAGSERDLTAGFTYEILPTSGKWPSGKTITLSVEIEDYGGKFTSYSYGFTTLDDTVPPTYEDAFPLPSSTEAAKDTDISVSIRDVGGLGVDRDTINLTVNGVPAVVAGVQQSPFTATITANLFMGWDVSVNKRPTDWDTYEDITVEVNAEDILDNYSEYSWSFRVTDYLGVLVTSLDPSNGETGVSSSTDITLHLTDAQAVVLPSITVEVDVTGTGSFYTTAFELENFLPNWDGPGKIYDASDPTHVIVTIDPVYKLPPNQLILVRVSADDPNGNPIRI